MHELVHVAQQRRQEGPVEHLRLSMPTDPAERQASEMVTKGTHSRGSPMRGPMLSSGPLLLRAPAGASSESQMEMVKRIVDPNVIRASLRAASHTATARPAGDPEALTRQSRIENEPRGSDRSGAASRSAVGAPTAGLQAAPSKATLVPGASPILNPVFPAGSESATAADRKGPLVSFMNPPLALPQNSPLGPVLTALSRYPGLDAMLNQLGDRYAEAHARHLKHEPVEVSVTADIDWTSLLSEVAGMDALIVLQQTHARLPTPGGRLVDVPAIPIPLTLPWPNALWSASVLVMPTGATISLSGVF